MTTTKKIAFFENLKETHGGKILVNDILKAWNLATCTLGKIKKNSDKTKKAAGYEIFENNEGDWISALDNRFEVNLATGQTYNIWTDASALENARNYAWDEVEFGLSYAKTYEEEVFWLNVCKAKFVNSFLRLEIKDLTALEIIDEREKIFARKAAEKSNAEIIACIDDYATDSDAAAEVEEVNAEIAKATVERKENISASGKSYFIDEVKEYPQSVETQEVDEVNAEIANAKKHFKVIAQDGYIYGLPDGDFALHGNKIFDLHDHELASFTTATEAEMAADELTAAFENGEEIFDFSISKNERLQAKIDEIKNRKHKSCIDWEDAYKQERLRNFFRLQKDFKKLLKIGEMKLAENIFENLKDLYKKFLLQNAQKKSTVEGTQFLPI